MVRKRSCPAVSQICSLTRRPSISTVLRPARESARGAERPRQTQAATETGRDRRGQSNRDRQGQSNRDRQRQAETEQQRQSNRDRATETGRDRRGQRQSSRDRQGQRWAGAEQQRQAGADSKSQLPVAHRILKSIPMVVMKLGSKVSSQKRMSRQVLPTELFPSSRIFTSAS